MTTMKKFTLAESNDAIAALPKPIVHLKGFASRILLSGASAPSNLMPGEESKIESETAEAERLAAQLLEAICASKPATLVWDGDGYSVDSFTALVPKVAERLPGIHLVAFAYESWGNGGFEKNWLPVVTALPTPSPFTVVIVPNSEADADLGPHAADQPLNVHDVKYVRLGRIGLQATGSKEIFSLGGSGVAIEETALALKDDPPSTITVAFVRRWVRPPGGGQDAPPAPRALELEHSATRFSLMRAQLKVIE